MQWKPTYLAVETEHDEEEHAKGGVEDCKGVLQVGKAVDRQQTKHPGHHKQQCHCHGHTQGHTAGGGGGGGEGGSFV